MQFPLLTLPWKSKISMNVNMLIRLRHLVTFRAQVRTNVSRDMCLQILCIIVLLCLSQPKSQLIQCMHMCLCCLCMNILLSVLSTHGGGGGLIGQTLKKVTYENFQQWSHRAY